MWHRVGYQLNGEHKRIVAHLTVAGEDETDTAMAKTVGLPLAISAKLFLEGKIKQRGVVIPIGKEIYDPVLTELNSLGIILKEHEA